MSYTWGRLKNYKLKHYYIQMKSNSNISQSAWTILDGSFLLIMTKHYKNWRWTATKTRIKDIKCLKQPKWRQVFFKFWKYWVVKNIGLLSKNKPFFILTLLNSIYIHIYTHTHTHTHTLFYSIIKCNLSGNILSFLVKNWATCFLQDLKEHIFLKISTLTS